VCGYEAVVADNGYVCESPCGGYWSIVDDNGYVVTRLLWLIMVMC